MSIYTVHQPPLRAAEVAPNPERFVFVRDGFYFWAFLLSALWMLRHRMWLVLVVYVVLVGGFEAALPYLGISSPLVGIIGLLISLLIGIEAGTLRRFTLARRGWKNVGVVAGDDLENAERRFFDAWAGGAARPAAPALPPPLPPRPLPRPPTEIVGLFPEPGASR